MLAYHFARTNYFAFAVWFVIGLAAGRLIGALT